MGLTNDVSKLTLHYNFVVVDNRGCAFALIQIFHFVGVLT